MNQIARTAKQLGAALRRARRGHKLTQAQLSKEVGLRQATISILESGEAGTRLATVLDVLTALDLQIVITERTKSSKKDLEAYF